MKKTRLRTGSWRSRPLYKDSGAVRSAPRCLSACLAHRNPGFGQPSVVPQQKGTPQVPPLPTPRVRLLCAVSSVSTWPFLYLILLLCVSSQASPSICICCLHISKRLINHPVLGLDAVEMAFIADFSVYTLSLCSSLFLNAPHFFSFSVRMANLSSAQLSKMPTCLCPPSLNMHATVSLGFHLCLCKSSVMLILSLSGVAPVHISSLLPPLTELFRPPPSL